MLKTALTSFVSAIIGGLLVFYAMTTTQPKEAKPIDTTPVAQSVETKKVPAEGYSAKDIYRLFAPGVVHIKSVFTQERTDFFGFELPPQQQEGSGSGFIIDKSGVIVTNAHVVQDSNTTASEITVVLSDNEEVPAKLLGTDPSTDIAVLKIDPGKKNLRVLKLADSSKLQVGDKVYAIGSPFDLEGTMTEGIISALNRTIDSPNPNFKIRGAIQTDAAVNPGNSGGPLINIYGEVVGINSQIASSSGSFAGIAFAIPSNTVKTIAAQIQKAGKAKHPWIGISGMNVDKELAKLVSLPVSKGVIIAQVFPNSPAEKAGLRGATHTLVNSRTGEEIALGGDIIVKIDNQDVNSMEDILNFVEEHKVGEKIKIEVYRGSKKITVDLTLGERPQSLNN